MVHFNQFTFNRVDMIQIDVDGWVCTSANCHDTDPVSIVYHGAVPIICWRDNGTAINNEDAQAIIEKLKDARHPIIVERLSVKPMLEVVK